MYSKTYNIWQVFAVNIKQTTNKKQTVSPIPRPELHVYTFIIGKVEMMVAGSKLQFCMILGG